MLQKETDTKKKTITIISRGIVTPPVQSLTVNSISLEPTYLVTILMALVLRLT